MGSIGALLGVRVRSLAAHLDFLHAGLKFFDFLGRELRAIDLNRQLVELGGERERRFVVRRRSLR